MALFGRTPENDHRASRGARDPPLSRARLRPAGKPPHRLRRVGRAPDDEASVRPRALRAHCPHPGRAGRAAVTTRSSSAGRASSASSAGPSPRRRMPRHGSPAPAGFPTQRRGSGDCALINCWQADDPAVSRFILAGLGPALAGCRAVYAKRHYPDGRVRPLRLAVSRRTGARPARQPTSREAPTQ